MTRIGFEVVNMDIEEKDLKLAYIHKSSVKFLQPFLDQEEGVEFAA
ncbi:hypothetical protein HZC08_01820 [Candidatus Micrarchaeota archaeon]|nr:hypothetical protein [Candidatus Micrarchaeota archaeon]